MKKKAYTVYIIECVDGSLYTGIARDADKRFAEHVEGKGARYTRSHPPRQIVFREQCRTRGAALRREHAIKSLTREEKLVLIRTAH